MIDCVSNYMIFLFIKMVLVVFCLSYKGKEQWNLEDLYDFVFCLFVIEWQNKIWFNLDLVFVFKKVVIKVFILYIGVIIGNKFLRYRFMFEQCNKFCEFVNSFVMIVFFLLVIL